MAAPTRGTAKETGSRTRRRRDEGAPDADAQVPADGEARRARPDHERAAARERLGEAIRSRRMELGRTLNDVGRATGLSVSLLSQVERGLVDPSLDSLRDVAFALETTPFTLLQERPNASRLVKRGHGLRLSLPHAEVEYELLSPSSDGRFQIAKAELQAGGATMKIPRAHPGEEAAMALHGTVYIEIAGERIRLEEGDLLTYDPTVPHRAIASDDGPATLLYVVSPPTL